MLENIVPPQPLNNDVAVMKILQLMGQLSPADLQYVLKAGLQVYKVVDHAN